MGLISSLLGFGGVHETRRRSHVCPRCGAMVYSTLKELVVFRWNMIFVCDNCRYEFDEEIKRCKDA